MIARALGRRNRFKKPERTARPLWRRMASMIDWRGLAQKGALLALLAACLAGLSWALNRPVRTVSMDGSFQRVSPVEIERAVAPYLAAGFMSADLDAIQRAVASLPWVDQVRVQRRWPTSLRVTVVEQTAAARWDDSGLLNTRGQLFVKVANHVPPELPRLSGPPGTETEVARLYLSAEPRMTEAGMHISALRLDERGAWEMDLSNGITVRLGRNQVDERIDRFIRVSAQVVAHQLNDISYVDMRYSNGFAIGWRTTATPAPAAAPKHHDDTDA